MQGQSGRLRKEYPITVMEVPLPCPLPIEVSKMCILQLGSIDPHTHKLYSLSSTMCHWNKLRLITAMKTSLFILQAKKIGKSYPWSLVS